MYDWKDAQFQIPADSLVYIHSPYGRKDKYLRNKKYKQLKIFALKQIKTINEAVQNLYSLWES